MFNEKSLKHYVLSKSFKYPLLFMVKIFGVSTKGSNISSRIKYTSQSIENFLQIFFSYIFLCYFSSYYTISLPQIKRELKKNKRRHYSPLTEVNKFY